MMQTESGENIVGVTTEGLIVEQPKTFWAKVYDLLMLYSRKARAVYFDAFLLIVTYFVVKYGTPSMAEDVKFLFAAIQPVFGIWIYGVSKEDVAKSQQR